MIKPTLTREQSDVLARVIREIGKEAVMKLHITASEWPPSCAAMKGIDTLTMAAAITNGWETEMTPVDILREDYRKRRRFRNDSFNSGWCDGVHKTLEATGQVVEGINA